MNCTVASLPLACPPLLACGVALMLTGCGKEAEKPAESKAEAAQPAEPKKVEAEILATLEVGKEIDGKELENAIEDFKRQHSFANAEEMLKLPAFTEKLGIVLRAMVKDQRLMDQMNKHVQMTADIKGVQGDSSNRHLDLNVTNYTPERTDRLLGAVLSGKPERVIEFVRTELDEASVEFSLAPEIERASNGMTIKRVDPPPPKP